MAVCFLCGGGGVDPISKVYYVYLFWIPNVAKNPYVLQRCDFIRKKLSVHKKSLGCFHAIKYIYHTKKRKKKDADFMPDYRGTLFEQNFEIPKNF